MTVGDTCVIVRYPNVACQCPYCICVLVFSVHWVVSVLLLSGTDAVGWWYKMHCGLIRWLLAYGLSVIILMPVLRTIGHYDSMTQLCSELIESFLYGSEWSRKCLSPSPFGKGSHSAEEFGC